MNADNGLVLADGQTYEDLMQTPEFKEARALGAGAFNKGDQLQNFVANTIFAQYKFVRVLDRGEHGTIYYRRMDPASNESYALRPLRTVDAEKMVRESLMQNYKIAPAQKVKTAMETMLVGVAEDIETVDNNLIEISHGMYWDTANAIITSDEELDKNVYERKQYCMRMLFDSEGTNEIKVDTSLIVVPMVMHIMRETVKHLKEHDGNIYPDDLMGEAFSSIIDLRTDKGVLAPFWTWANGDVEVMNDLLKAVASNFMEHKPKGAFVLIGLKRNGKSSFVKMLHTLFGRNNTSSVRLADFNNHGLNGELWTTMMNAPDEEDEGTGNSILEVQGNFKSIAAHEALKLRKLYAQTGQWVNSDFMCFFPMNHFPEWKGSGASACMQRTLPIFFDNDLSKYDNSGKDFARETFTPYFFQDLLGIVLGIAQYYHDRPLVFSERMSEGKRKVETSVDNVNMFINQFLSYFRGFSKKGIVFQEYRLWCIERDLEPQSKSVLSTAIELRDCHQKIFYRDKNDAYGERVTQVINDDSKPYFMMSQRLPELGYKTVEDFLMGEKDAAGHFNNTGVRSVINALENLREKELAEQKEVAKANVKEQAEQKLSQAKLGEQNG